MQFIAAMFSGLWRDFYRLLSRLAYTLRRPDGRFFISIAMELAAGCHSATESVLANGSGGGPGLLFGMGKKKTDRKKSDAGRAAKPPARRSSKHTDALLTVGREEQGRFFATAPGESLAEVFEESYVSDLVNILLDLKKSVVKRAFEEVAAARKKALPEVATLYYYKEYLTNPLPLRVEAEAGRQVPNYYAILGVPRDASDEDLRAAYRLLERAHDPEHFSPAMRKAGEERLAEIHEAYENLKNPPRRAQTDRLLPNINYLYPRRDQSWFEAYHKVLA